MTETAGGTAMAKAKIGVYGLGTMGSALALNLAEHGIVTAVTNRETDWIAPFLDRAGPLADTIVPADTVEDFVAAIAPPRMVLLMIPSGAPVDAMIGVLRPLMAGGDTIIDAGNSDFNDTRRRAGELGKTGIHFVGMGVSGGAEGARNGPSMMVGSDDASWTRLRPVVEAIAARFMGDPCVAHIGPDGAGHFVKTVHNGIEYADMQQIAEIYGLLRDGTGWGAGQIADMFARWNTGPLASYLTEITAQVLAATDPDTGQPVADIILDRAGQKGTGRWTVIEALKLGQSASAIEAAVGARGWSSEKATRETAADILPAANTATRMPAPDVLEQAFLAARILAHAQGFRVLAAASAEFGWGLDLARIAEIWRAGCIIRSALLDDIADAFHAGPPCAELVLAPQVQDKLAGGIGPLRDTVAAAVSAGIPVPSLAAALGWYDDIRRARGTANLIQAQRDFFGAHGFRRTDRPGDTHGPWHKGG